MFGIFKTDPVKKLDKAYQQKLEEALHAQRRGDIRTYSLLSAEADVLWREMCALKEQS